MYQRLARPERKWHENVFVTSSTSIQQRNAHLARAALFPRILGLIDGKNLALQA
jgi:hypothetical protein